MSGSGAGRVQGWADALVDSPLLLLVLLLCLGWQLPSPQTSIEVSQQVEPHITWPAPHELTVPPELLLDTPGAAGPILMEEPELSLHPTIVL